MQVEQAIFTSARTDARRGYQLVARSPGIPDRVARFLGRWCPSHGSLQGEESRAASLNYFPIDHEWVVCSRTVYGGPEYSGRGVLQINTYLLVLKRSQLAGYDNHPLHVLQMAQLLGLLRLSAERTGLLSTLEIPNRKPQFMAVPPADENEAVWITRSLNLLKTRRLAWIGLADPIRRLEQMIATLPLSQRLEISFNTGLHVSLHRQFRLQILREVPSGTHQRLHSQHIQVLRA